MKGRLEILDLYLNKIKRDSSVDIQKLAKMTVGFSGADLENVVNTAAIRAAVEGKQKQFSFIKVLFVTKYFVKSKLAVMNVRTLTVTFITVFPTFFVNTKL